MMRPLLLVLLVGMTLLFAALSGSCMRDLSGLTVDSQGRILAVNNRPGVFAHCKPKDGRLDCESLPFDVELYRRYDFEGVTSVNEHLFYAVIEKRNNNCLSGCELSQEVLAFRLGKDGKVRRAACPGLTIPLFEKDRKNCRFANCGLEGVAYDPDRNRLYVAKETWEPRLFSVSLDENHCPTGEFQEIHPPETRRAYNDLAYSSKRQSLFILSGYYHTFLEWNLKENRIVLNAEKDLPEATRFMEEHTATEGIYIDDETETVWLLTEKGAFFTARLPSPSAPNVKK